MYINPEHGRFIFVLVLLYKDQSATTEFLGLVCGLLNMAMYGSPLLIISQVGYLI